MEAAQQKQFKYNDEIREKVLNFGECYYGALRPEENGSYPEFLSALNKQHPEINLKSHVTFFKYFPGFIEKWKRDFKLPSRAKSLTNQFKQSAEETFIISRLARTYSYVFLGQIRTNTIVYVSYVLRTYLCTYFCVRIAKWPYVLRTY